MKRGPLVWLAVIVPVWLAFALCAYWEPVLRDGWGHVQWHRSFSTTPGNVWQFAHDSFVHNNPRLGQVLTLLVYTPGPWHVIVTPIVELGMFYLLTLHALGRRPSFQRVDDALMFATILAMVGLTAPLVGQMLFYRPFTGNYLFSFTIALAFFVPYRLHADAPAPRRWWWIPIMLVAGFATGLGNEHTGPAFVAVVIAAILGFWKRGERPAPWMIAGLIGALAGGLALYFAPAQSIRYNALATSQSLVERITARSLGESLRIIGGAFTATWLLIPWVALAAPRWRDPLGRTRIWVAVVALGASFAIMLTLLASPKQGGRLDFAPICLGCTVVASVVLPLVQSAVQRAIAWLLAAAGVGFLLVHLIATYAVVGPEFRARFDAIEGAPPHAVVTVQRYSLARSRWFLGEDFGQGADGLRFGIAWSRQLQGVLLDQPAEANLDPGGP